MTELDRLSLSLQHLRNELSPTSADKDRLRARILAPRGPGSGAPLAREPLTRWVALRASGKLGLTLGALLLGTGVMLGVWWGSERAPRSLIAQPPPDSSNSVIVAAPSAQANAGSEAVPATPAAPPSAVPRALSPASPASRAARSPSTPKLMRAASAPRATGVIAPDAVRSPELDGELALLRRVEHALRENEPDLALALLAELDERHPDTRLAEERTAARRIAECRAARPDAITAARSFLLEHATSVYRQRIQQSCALGEQNPESADTHAR